jgi:hypothetical protein
VAGGQGSSDDLIFTGSRPDLDSVIVLDLAYLGGDLSATVEQVDEIQVELIDSASQTG